MPRQRLQVLTAGKSPAPLNEKSGDGATFAGIESATAEINLGAFDVEAPRFVLESRLFFVATYCGLIELFSDLLISGHGLSLRINCQIRCLLQPSARAFSAAVLLLSISAGSILRRVAM